MNTSVRYWTHIRLHRDWIKTSSALQKFSEISVLWTSAEVWVAAEVHFSVILKYFLTSSSVTYGCLFVIKLSKIYEFSWTSLQARGDLSVLLFLRKQCRVTCGQHRAHSDGFLQLFNGIYYCYVVWELFEFVFEMFRFHGHITLSVFQLRLIRIRKLFYLNFCWNWLASEPA